MDLSVGRQAGLQPDVHVVRTDASLPELHTAFPAEKAQVAHADLPGAVRGGEHQQHRHVQQRSLPGVELDGEGRFRIDGQHVVPAAHQIPLRHGYRETGIEGQVRQRIPSGLLPDAREEIRPAARRRIRQSVLHPQGKRNIARRPASLYPQRKVVVARRRIGRGLHDRPDAAQLPGRDRLFLAPRHPQGNPRAGSRCVAHNEGTRDAARADHTHLHQSVLPHRYPNGIAHGLRFGLSAEHPGKEPAGSRGVVRGDGPQEREAVFPVQGITFGDEIRAEGFARRTREVGVRFGSRGADGVRVVRGEVAPLYLEGFRLRETDKVGVILRAVFPGPDGPGEGPVGKVCVRRAIEDVFAGRESFENDYEPIGRELPDIDIAYPLPVRSPVHGYVPQSFCGLFRREIRRHAPHHVGTHRRGGTGDVHIRAYRGQRLLPRVRGLRPEGHRGDQHQEQPGEKSGAGFFFFQHTSVFYLRASADSYRYFLKSKSTDFSPERGKKRRF